jgi:hypothetical protein
MVSETNPKLSIPQISTLNSLILVCGVFFIFPKRKDSNVANRWLGGLRSGFDRRGKVLGQCMVSRPIKQSLIWGEPAKSMSNGTLKSVYNRFFTDLRVQMPFSGTPKPLNL